MNDRGEKIDLGLKAVKWLESNGVMNIVDFMLELNLSEEFITLRFRKKKNYKFFKDNKKAIRNYG